MNRKNADRLVYRESLQNGLADMMIASFFIVPAVVIDKPALAGELFSGGLVYAGRRSGLLRYHLLTLVSSAGGILLALLVHSGTYLGLRIYLLVMGILVFGNGLFLFRRFVRTHPILEEETNGHE